jgi:hypothetical protein
MPYEYVAEGSSTEDGQVPRNPGDAWRVQLWPAIEDIVDRSIKAWQPS